MRARLPILNVPGVGTVIGEVLRGMRQQRLVRHGEDCAWRLSPSWKGRLLAYPIVKSGNASLSPTERLARISITSSPSWESLPARSCVLRSASQLQVSSDESAGRLALVPTPEMILVPPPALRRRGRPRHVLCVSVVYQSCISRVTDAKVVMLPVR